MAAHHDRVGIGLVQNVIKQRTIDESECTRTHRRAYLMLTGRDHGDRKALIPAEIAGFEPRDLHLAPRGGIYRLCPGAKTANHRPGALGAKHV